MRNIWVTQSTLQECLQLTHKTKFIVLHGVTQEQIRNHNNSGLWIQETYKRNVTILQEHRATRLEEERLAEEDPTKLGTGAR
jgi:aromatic ring-cleaving dioxygenase